MWEWYFRTSLDHWSTFLGMIFALNYPATSQWVKKVESLPAARQWLIKGSVAAVLMSVTAWWAMNILPVRWSKPQCHYCSFFFFLCVLCFVDACSFFDSSGSLLKEHSFFGVGVGGWMEAQEHFSGEVQ